MNKSNASKINIWTKEFGKNRTVTGILRINAVSWFSELRIRLTEDELFFYEKDSGRAVFRYFSLV